jgi:hypothetical protein
VGHNRGGVKRKARLKRRDKEMKRLANKEKGQKEHKETTK